MNQNDAMAEIVQIILTNRVETSDFFINNIKRKENLI